jgi:hypothetical protein
MEKAPRKNTKEMNQPTIEQLHHRFIELGHKWFPFHVIAIRSKANVPNKFDDLIGFVANDTVTWHSGTTNAGTYHLNNPSRVEGTAMLKEGQYVDAWQLGKHKGVYDALTQAKSVTVYRDGDKDSLSEVTNVTENGYFGINWHRANENAISQNVDKWSAGCMVQNDPKQYDTFIKACSESGNIYFTGTILNEWL